MSELFAQLGIDPKVIAAMIPGFLLLWWVLARFLFRPVMALLKTREEEIRSTYETAEGEKSRAEQFRSEWETRLSGVEAEARAKLQQAVKDAQSAKDDIIAEARTRSEDLLRKAQEDLAREREKTLATIREDVVNMALSAAGKLIGESMDDQRHRQLVSDFIDKIGTAQ